MMENNTTGKKFKRVCVFCGSSSGNRSVFSDAALDLGKELVSRKLDLVYGGGSSGLMGLIAKTVFDGGCHVLGVIPKALLPEEFIRDGDNFQELADQCQKLGVSSLQSMELLQLPYVQLCIDIDIICLQGEGPSPEYLSLVIQISGETFGNVIRVADMHERKAEMARQSDAFIALPGGYGTMEELMEVIAWSQLGIHDKPIGLLNVDGYYNSLLALFDNGVLEGFIKPAARHIILSAATVHELMLKMEEYTPLHEQVAPRHSWEIEQLAYLDKVDPSC